MQSNSSDFLYSSLLSDPDLSELGNQFAEEMSSKIAAIETAHQRNDEVQLLRLVHQLKGAAGSYGFPAITPIAANLEQSLKANPANPARIIVQMEELVSICNRVRPSTSSASLEGSLN